MMIDPLHRARAPGYLALKWSGETDRGKVRGNNEDSFLGLQFDAHEIHLLGKTGEAPSGPTDFVFAVSDGMGGAMAGEFASRITVEKITRLLPRSFIQAATGIDAGYTDILTELFSQIHRALTFVGGSYEECAGMQATLSLCWFTSGWMYYAHIGDSRIYYLPAKETTLRQLSHDDTHVGWLFRTGAINEREARHHPRRTALQKALGGGNQFISPQVGAVACERGDRFLLCTDGVVDGLYDAQLAELLLDPKLHGARNHAHLVVRNAVDTSGRDNTTAVVIELE
jgi:protein phosphatase